MTDFDLQVCVDSVDSALIAEKNGATSLALCSNLIIGGTTPTSSLIESVKEHTSIPVHVMIKPRSGDYLYSPLEFDVMKRDVVMAKRHLADGIIIGCLTPTLQLDQTRLRSLIDLASTLTITLNNCIELCSSIQETLVAALALPIHRIFISNHLTNSIPIKELSKQISSAIDIVSFGNITEQNAKDFLSLSGSTSYCTMPYTSLEHTPAFLELNSTVSSYYADELPTLSKALSQL